MILLQVHHQATITPGAASIVLLLVWHGARTAVPLTPSSPFFSTYGAMIQKNREQSLCDWAMSTVFFLLMNLRDLFKMKYHWRLHVTWYERTR